MLTETFQENMRVTRCPENAGAGGGAGGVLQGATWADLVRDQVIDSWSLPSSLKQGTKC